MSTPYYLKPKDTKLPAGHDDTLDPPVDPTDAETRGVPPTDWAAVDVSKGGTAPPDKALSPPPVDPAIRSVPVSTWPRGLPEFIAGRPVHLAIPVPDLDPDIALWRVVTLNIWPFTGAPTEGEFPRGWMGIDNTSTVWVCTVGGEPGTWVEIGAAGPAGGWPTNDGTGPGNLTAETPSDDTVGYSMTDQGSGGISLWSHGTGDLDLTSDNKVVIACGSTPVTDKILVQAGGSAMFMSMDQTRLIIDISADDVNQLLLRNLFTTDPGVTDAVWNDNGVLVLSGVTQVGALQHDANQVLNVGSTGSDQTLLTTASLAVGTWLINASFIWEAAATGNNAGISMIDGTATATFTGQNAGGGSAYDASIDVPGSLTCLAHITVAGTLIVQGLAQNTGTWLSAGYTAVRIA